MSKKILVFSLFIVGISFLVAGLFCFAGLSYVGLNYLIGILKGFNIPELVYYIVGFVFLFPMGLALIKIASEGD